MAVQFLSCQEGDTLEQACCCWIRARAPNVVWGHTYLFDPVTDPVIAARIAGGPSEQRDITDAQIWIRRGTENIGTEWQRFGTGPLPRFPDDEVTDGFVFAVEGPVTGVQFGSRTSAIDFSQIALCENFDPNKISAGDVVEIDAAPDTWKKDAETACQTFAVPCACTVDSVIGSITPDFRLGEPIGSLNCFRVVLGGLALVGAGFIISSALTREA